MFIVVKKRSFGNSGPFILRSAGKFPWPNPDEIKVLKIVFHKGGLLFKDDYDAVIALMNADILEHTEKMLSEMDSVLEKITIKNHLNRDWQILLQT